MRRGCFLLRKNSGVCAALCDARQGLLPWLTKMPPSGPPRHWRLPDVQAIEKAAVRRRHSAPPSNCCVRMGLLEASTRDSFQTVGARNLLAGWLSTKSRTSRELRKDTHYRTGACAPTSARAIFCTDHLAQRGTSFASLRKETPRPWQTRNERPQRSNSSNAAFHSSSAPSGSLSRFPSVTSKPVLREA